MKLHNRPGTISRSCQGLFFRRILTCGDRFAGHLASGICTDRVRSLSRSGAHPPRHATTRSRSHHHHDDRASLLSTPSLTTTTNVSVAFCSRLSAARPLSPSSPALCRQWPPPFLPLPTKRNPPLTSTSSTATRTWSRPSPSTPTATAAPLDPSMARFGSLTATRTVPGACATRGLPTAVRF